MEAQSRVRKINLLLWFLILGTVAWRYPNAPDESLPTGKPERIMAWNKTHPDYSRCSACHDAQGMLIISPLLTMAGWR